MPETRHFLLRLEFLGFRYHGWQQQPGQKTLEGMLRKTLRFACPGSRVKLLGAGRTDAMVSAQDYGVQLELTGEEAAPEELAHRIDVNLPPDMRVVSLVPIAPGFNAIRDTALKTYGYYFCFGAKPHPYCAPFLGYFPGDLLLEEMQEAAACFVGNHDFHSFIAAPSPNSQTLRSIQACTLEENKSITGSFFPDLSYVLKVTGEGFGRYQVRLMMAALVAIGRKQASSSDLQKALQNGTGWSAGTIAPASGLHLIQVHFNPDKQ